MRRVTAKYRARIRDASFASDGRELPPAHMRQEAEAGEAMASSAQVEGSGTAAGIRLHGGSTDQTNSSHVEAGGRLQKI
jgi:hypothetical protein